MIGMSLLIDGTNCAVLRFDSILKAAAPMSTLQQRVAGLLNESAPAYVAEESEADAVNSIFDMLEKAEAELDAAQTRVDNLKWKLLKAQEHQI